MTRKEMRNEMRKATCEALETIISEMEKTGRAYSTSELSEMTGGYLTPTEISAFLVRNIDYWNKRYSPNNFFIKNGTSIDAYERRYHSLTPEEVKANDPYVVLVNKKLDLEKREKKTILGKKTYVNVDDPTDKITRTVIKKESTYALK